MPNPTSDENSESGCGSESGSGRAILPSDANADVDLGVPGGSAPRRKTKSKKGDRRAVQVRPDLFALIVLGMLLGVACGLFFGELCDPLAVIGDVFVGLLRVTVLPYVGVALMANLARLKLKSGFRLLRTAVGILGVLWAISLATASILPLTFPEWRSGSFFSSAMIDPAAEFDLVKFLVPANIFSALAENQVPAIVVFCIACGMALAKVKGRKGLIKQLDVASAMLIRVSLAIAHLAPIGVFAITASTVGSVSLVEMIRLQGYLVAYACGAVFLAFVVFPLLVSAVTPLGYRQVLGVAKEPMLTAFVTGKLIIVLPLLIRNTTRLMEQIEAAELEIGETRVGSKHGGASSERATPGEPPPSSEVFYATAYPFPHSGKLLSILFIPFSAWFMGGPLELGEYPMLLVSGLFAYFGGPIVAVPYLLDLMRLPHDMFQLFLLSGVIGERLGDAVGAMHLAAFSLIGRYYFMGRLKLRFGRCVRLLVTVLLVGTLALVAVRVSLFYFVGSVQTRTEIIEAMQLIETPAESTFTMTGDPNPVPLRPGESLMQRIRRRGVLRVGFNEDKVPFAFFNQRGNLVGYDVNMAHALAKDLNVRLEFVRFDRATLADQLRADHFDVVMTGLVGTLRRAEQMRHTESYLDVNLALVVPDYRTREFKTVAGVDSNRPLRIAYVDLSLGFLGRLREALPAAEFIKLGRNRDFFIGRNQGSDALLISAESGSALALMYPQFEVVVPEDLQIKLPLFYVVGDRGVGFRDFLEHWVSLRQKDGTAQEYYNHWILGKSPRPQPPRWCVIRDVLHWID